jgi:hypothetical protein
LDYDATDSGFEAPPLTGGAQHIPAVFDDKRTIRVSERHQDGRHQQLFDLGIPLTGVRALAQDSRPRLHGVAAYRREQGCISVQGSAAREIAFSPSGCAAMVSASTTVIRDTEGLHFNDKESITADPTRPGFVYAVWDCGTLPGEPRSPVSGAHSPGPDRDRHRLPGVPLGAPQRTTPPTSSRSAPQRTTPPTSSRSAPQHRKRAGRDVARRCPCWLRRQGHRAARRGETSPRDLVGPDHGGTISAPWIPEPRSPEAGRGAQRAVPDPAAELSRPA